MFRYLGFSWDPAAPAQVACARRMAESIGRDTAWRPALSSAGACVFTVGGRAGVNGSYVLPSGQGVVIGRLFRRRDGASTGRDMTLTEAEGARILQTEGRALIEDHWGRYVAVLRSRRRGTALLRDPSGALPCYVKCVDGVAVFFSWLEDFIAVAQDCPAPSVNWDAVTALVAAGHLGGPRTALEGISQVLPGQLTMLEEGAEPPISLWSAVDIAGRPLEFEPQIAAERLRQVVQDCVHAWSSCYDSTLLRLSGGLDSAILLGCLATAPIASRIVCLNYFSPESDSDERPYARLAAAKSGASLVERALDDTFSLENVLFVSRTPAPEPYVGRMDTSRTDAEVAETHGTPAMFTGSGGDQLFFEHRCAWPAADYLSVRGFDRGFFGASVDAARLAQVSLWESIRQALLSRHHRGKPFDGIAQQFKLVSREALRDVRHPERYLHPDLPGALGLPIGKFHHVENLINPFGYYDPYLPEVAPELVNPLMSQPVMELCLGLPTWLLSHGGRGRALVRRAFTRELPREIATRQSKGGIGDHASTILHRNLPLARELLLDGHLVRHGLLDRKKLEAALTERLSALGGYPGEVHHHIATEVWLRRFAESAT